MKKTILPLLCLTTALTTFSQNNFQKGYIVSPAGDTTNGYLKRSTYAELAQIVEFRVGNENAASAFYKPQTLKAFAFDEGDLFRSVQYNDPLDSNNLRKSEFARLALEGYYSVYALARGTSSDYVIKDADTTYLLYDDALNSMGLLLYRGNFRNTLAFLSRNCGGSAPGLENMVFLEDRITHAVRQLNKCHQSNSVVRRQKAKLKKDVVVHAGYFEAKGKWSQFSAGAELRLRNPILSRKLYLLTGLHYSRTIDVNSSKYAAYAYYYGIPYTTGFKNTTEIYSLPVALHYTFTEHAVQPYVYAGVAAAYKSINFASTFFDKGLQGKYGLSMLGGVGIEVYPVRFIAIKADWRYELLMQYPTLGVAVRF